MNENFRHIAEALENDEKNARLKINQNLGGGYDGSCAYAWAVSATKANHEAILRTAESQERVARALEN